MAAHGGEYWATGTGCDDDVASQWQQIVRVRRLARAREELTETAQPVSVIAHRWGFSDTSHFSRSFKAHYGSSPTDYRNAVQAARTRGGAPVQPPVAAVQGAEGARRETEVTAAPS